MVAHHVTASGVECDSLSTYEYSEVVMFSRLFSNPIANALIALAVAATVIGVWSLILGRYSESGFLEGILIEAHGMVLDILVIGVFILILNRLGQKQLDIRRYEEEIDDFSLDYPDRLKW